MPVAAEHRDIKYPNDCCGCRQESSQGILLLTFGVRLSMLSITVVTVTAFFKANRRYSLPFQRRHPAITLTLSPTFAATKRHERVVVKNYATKFQKTRDQPKLTFWILD